MRDRRAGIATLSPYIAHPRDTTLQSILGLSRRGKRATERGIEDVGYLYN